jgi:hypothetical protein
MELETFEKYGKNMGKNLDKNFYPYFYHTSQMFQAPLKNHYKASFDSPKPVCKTQESIDFF